MRALMLDVFSSLRKDGFETIFCVSGQGDALHNQTMAEAIRRGRAEIGVRAYFVVGSAWAERLGFAADDAQFLIYPLASTPSPYADVHAGAGETSMAWGFFPDVVRTDMVRTLRSTDLGADDLTEWRRGWSNARRKTPLGYLGDPSAGDPERGRMMLETQANLVAEAIVAKLASGSP
jgi:creatinine amidohydrolase